MTQGFSVSWLRKGGGISFCCQIGMFRFDLQKWMCDSSNAWASKKLNLLVFFVKDEACPIFFVWRSFKWRIVSPFSRNLFKVVRIGPNDTIFIPKAIAGGVSSGLMDWCVGEMVKSDFTQTCWIFLYFFGWFRLFSESQRQVVTSLCRVCFSYFFSEVAREKPEAWSWDVALVQWRWATISNLCVLERFWVRTGCQYWFLLRSVSRSHVPKPGIFCGLKRRCFLLRVTHWQHLTFAVGQTFR